MHGEGGLIILYDPLPANGSMHSVLQNRPYTNVSLTKCGANKGSQIGCRFQGRRVKTKGVGKES